MYSPPPPMQAPFTPPPLHRVAVRSAQLWIAGVRTVGWGSCLIHTGLLEAVCALAAGSATGSLRVAAAQTRAPAPSIHSAVLRPCPNGAWSPISSPGTAAATLPTPPRATAPACLAHPALPPTPARCCLLAQPWGVAPVLTVLQSIQKAAGPTTRTHAHANKQCSRSKTLRLILSSACVFPSS